MIRRQSEDRSCDIARATRSPPGRGEGQGSLEGDSRIGRAANGERGVQIRCRTGDRGSRMADGMVDSGVEGFSGIEVAGHGGSRAGGILKSIDS